MKRSNLYPIELLGVSSLDSFGMLMRERAYSSASYRFGFNGKEKTDEVNGDGNSLDFGARIYDSRIGRWLSIDPLFRNYSSISPFTFGANNPIIYIDCDGQRIYYVNDKGEVIEINSSNLSKIDNIGVRQGFEALISTSMGKKIFDKYANSEDIDVYMAVGTVPGGEGYTAKAVKENGTFQFTRKYTLPIARELFDSKIVSAKKDAVFGIVFDRLEFGLNQDTRIRSNSYKNSNSEFHELLHVLLDSRRDHEKMGWKYIKGEEYILKGGKIDRFLIQLNEYYINQYNIAYKNNDKSGMEKYERLNIEIQEFRKKTVLSKKDFKAKKAPSKKTT